MEVKWESVLGARAQADPVGVVLPGYILGEPRNEGTCS